MKKALVIRLGALGDHLIISPVLNKLKQDGYYIIFNTNKRGRDIFANANYIDEFLDHDENMPVDDLEGHWEKLKADIKPDKYINFTGSIEQALALHPSQPLYIYPKSERQRVCDVNYYEYAEKVADITLNSYLPVINFSTENIEEAKKYIKPDRFNLLWCLSGSGKNKTYPWTDYVMGSLIQKIPNINIITVGDFKCKILEVNGFPEKNLTELAGEVPIMISIALTKLVDVVVSPDTAVLHASGAFRTPKVGLLGHTTKENITKHFVNDFSIQSKASCAPCFRLIYDHVIQCPCDYVSGAAWCMSEIAPEEVFENILKAYDRAKRL